jgi:hypothetical protein
MKSVLFLLLICFAKFGYSQIGKQATELSKDPIFYQNLKLSFSLSKEIYKAQNYDLKNMPTLENQIREIGKDKNLTDVEMFSKIQTILNLSKSLDLKLVFDQITSNTNFLKEKYGANFNNETIQGAVNEVLKAAPADLGGFDYGGDGGGCKNQAAYNWCSAGCYSAAALAYGGCLGTIFGAPACFALVAAGQTSCIALCYYSWCK